MMINIKTTQTSALKTAFDGINSLLNDANLEFDTDVGITLKEVDKTGRIFVHARFDKECFDNFEVYSNRTIGFDINSLNKCFKNANTFDVITMEYDGGEKFKIVLESHTKKLKKTFLLKTLELPMDSSSIKPIDFTHCLTMVSKDFHVMCKELSHYSDKLNITVKQDRVIFGCSSGMGDIECERKCGNKLKIEYNDDAPIVASYDLKYLLLFAKCADLSDLVEIYIKNTNPLIMKYKLASLGELKLVLHERHKEV
jgi:proliferating cell nuclear antigen